MCSTCNHNYYKTVTEEVNGRAVERLEQSLGYGSLTLRCNPDGKSYYLTVKGEAKSQFKCYRCPTCGRSLD